MAIDWTYETRSTEQKVVKLAADTSNTSNYLSDQMVHKLGTNRRSEIRGVITDTGQNDSKIINDYLDNL